MATKSQIDNLLDSKLSNKVPFEPMEPQVPISPNSPITPKEPMNTIAPIKTKEAKSKKAGFWLKPSLYKRLKKIAYDRRLSLNDIADEALNAFCDRSDSQEGFIPVYIPITVSLFEKTQLLSQDKGISINETIITALEIFCNEK